MFASIETNGASHIVIHIPHEGADKSLPALASMLENNATFIRKGYREADVVKPTMSITLGDRFETEAAEQEILIAPSSHVIREDFVPSTREVFVSNAKTLARKEDEISKLRTEMSYIKDQLSRAQETIKALTNTEEA